MSNIKKIGIILKNVALAYVIAMILFVVYAFILEFTNVPETSMPLFVFVTMLISVFISSSLSLIKFKENGLLNGGLVGLVYILILYILSSIFVTGFSINAYSFWMIAFSIIIGMIGGIIGVNMCKEG